MTAFTGAHTPNLAPYYIERIAPFVRKLLSVVIAVGMTIVTSQYIQYAIRYPDMLDLNYAIRLALVLAVTGYACYDLFVYDAVIAAHLKRPMTPAHAIELFFCDIAQVFVLGAMIQINTLVLPFASLSDAYTPASFNAGLLYLLIATGTWHLLIWSWHCIADKSYKWSAHSVLALVYCGATILLVALTPVFDPIFAHWRAVIVLPLYAVVLYYLFFIRTSMMLKRAERSSATS
jgi:hypothetical protein